jgi:hypothetical protein
MTTGTGPGRGWGYVVRRLGPSDEGDESDGGDGGQSCNRACLHHLHHFHTSGSLIKTAVVRDRVSDEVMKVMKVRGGRSSCLHHLYHFRHLHHGGSRVRPRSASKPPCSRLRVRRP